MLLLFFMFVPQSPNNKKSQAQVEDKINSKITPEEGVRLVDFINDNMNVDEIKIQIDKENKINRIITKEIIPIPDAANIETFCRQYSNQDILIKIRNGKKTVIERTRITNQQK